MEPDWVLWDYRVPSEEIEHAPKLPILSAEDLVGRLSAVRQDDPGVYLLCSPQGDHLRIGISEDYGFLTWVDPRTKKLLVGLPGSTEAPDELYFKFEGQYEETPRNELIPYSTLVDSAVHYYRTGQLSPHLVWKQN